MRETRSGASVEFSLQIGCLTRTSNGQALLDRATEAHPGNFRKAKLDVILSSRGPGVIAMLHMYGVVPQLHSSISMLFWLNAKPTQDETATFSSTVWFKGRSHLPCTSHGRNADKTPISTPGLSVPRTVKSNHSSQGCMSLLETCHRLLSSTPECRRWCHAVGKNS